MAEGLIAPIGNMEILRNVHKIPARAENFLGKREKPRASGLMSDAREIAYYMAGVPLSNPHMDNEERVDGAFTQEQGRLAEQITADAINQSELLRVVHTGDDQLELPSDAFVTGHPDGELEFLETPGVWSALNEQGCKVGWEHKHLGRFQYKKIAADGLEAGYPEIIAQMLCYGYHLEWDACMACITSQDASSMRLELRGIKTPWAHPKMMVFYVGLREMYDQYIPYLKKRAEWFTKWAAEDGDPLNVAVEAKNVKGIFPWGYSEYRDLGINDPAGTLVAPMSPLVRDWAK